MRRARAIGVGAAMAVSYLLGRRASRRMIVSRPEALPVAAGPARGGGWWGVVRTAWRKCVADGVPLMAAGVAFYSFLALSPTLIAVVSVYGLVADPAQVERQVRGLSRVLPAESAALVADQLRDIDAISGRALGIGLAVSILGAFFTASGGVANLVRAVDIAYHGHSRGFLRLRLTALLLTFGAVVFLVVSLGLVVVLPVVLRYAGIGGLGRTVAEAGRWAGLAVALAIASAVLHRIAGRQPLRLAPGTVVVAVLGLAGSAGFSVYADHFGSYGQTYGTLTGVVVLMLWLFLTAFVLLLGAEINVAAGWPVRGPDDVEETP